MTSKRLRLLRILSVAALFLIAAGQLLHAADLLSVRCAASECEHHSDAATDECPAEHSCCHAHGTSLVLPNENSRLLGTTGRTVRFFVSDEALPEGSLRDIDHPPQLS